MRKSLRTMDIWMAVWTPDGPLWDKLYMSVELKMLFVFCSGLTSLSAIFSVISRW